MDIERNAAGAFVLKLTEAELTLVSNALNHATHALQGSELSTVLGGPRKKVEALLDQIGAALDGKPGKK